GRFESLDVFCECTAYYSKPDNLWFETVTPRNQYNVTRVYSSFRLSSELGADLTVTPIIRIPYHESRARPDGRLPPGPHSCFVVSDVWRNDPIGPIGILGNC